MPRARGGQKDRESGKSIKSRELKVWPKGSFLQGQVSQGLSFLVPQKLYAFLPQGQKSSAWGGDSGKPEALFFSQAVKEDWVDVSLDRSQDEEE